MSLTDKKISELTAEEIQSLAKPIGFEGLAYPMVKYRILQKDQKDESGRVVAKENDVVQEVGVIDKLTETMTVYTEMPMEKVMGKLYREMPIPSMLPMLRDLIAKQAPDSTNRIFTVLGDPAFGKSFLFKSFAGIVHPQGAIQVDCGGMNMREIFFRTVIDCGEGVQDVLNKRMADGKVNPAVIAYMNAEFPDSVVTKNGQSVIDWNRIGARKTEKNGNEKEVSVEDRRAAIERGISVMSKVYDMEKISHQNNSFGIKTVPGEFFEAIRSGRPLFLDEFNKHKMGTLDCWQTALQVLNGEEAVARVYNPMGQSGGDSLKFLEVRREDFKTGFIVGVAGNEGRDGDSTKELSESMTTRLNPMYVGSPTLLDWKHRESQIWTGLPLTTLYLVYQDFAHNKPDEFSKFLWEMRTLGLNNHEIAAIPGRQKYFLQNWKETIQAVNQVSDVSDFRRQLADPRSKLFDNRTEYKDLGDEINSDARAKQIGVSFRKSIANHNRAIKGSPAVQQTAKNLTPNIQEAFQAVRSAGVIAKGPGWHRFGANLSEAIIEDIVNVTKDMPKTRATLIGYCTTQGIIPAVFKEAKPAKDVKPLAELMKYDENKDLGGTDELRAVQGVIMMALRSIYPEIKASDDQVIPLRNLGSAIQSLKDAGKTEDMVKQIIIPNDDLNGVKTRPLVVAQAVANYNLGEDAAKGGNLLRVDFRSALAAMAIPEYAEKNREKIWLNDLLKIMKGDGAKKDIADNKELFNMLMGKSQNNLHLAVISAANAKGEAVFLYVLEDKQRGETMIVGPEKISVPLAAALEKNGVIYLSKTEPGTDKKIDEFMTLGARARHQKNVAQKDPRESTEVVKTLILAIGRLGGLPEKYMGRGPKGEPMIKEGATLGSIIVDAEPPIVYTNFVKTPAPGR